MSEKKEVKDLNEAKERLKKIIKKEKLTNIPLNIDTKNNSKKYNK